MLESFQFLKKLKLSILESEKHNVLDLSVGKTVSRFGSVKNYI